MTAYWTKAEREEWRWLQDLKREDLPEDSAPAQLRLSELRRILATVDALEKFITGYRAAAAWILDEQKEPFMMSLPQVEALAELDLKARVLLAALEGKP